MAGKCTIAAGERLSPKPPGPFAAPIQKLQIARLCERASPRREPQVEILHWCGGGPRQERAPVFGGRGGGGGAPNHFPFLPFSRDSGCALFGQECRAPPKIHVPTLPPPLRGHAYS